MKTNLRRKSGGAVVRSFSWPEELDEKVRSRCLKEGLSFTEFIRHCVRTEMKQSKLRTAMQLVEEMS